jgi:hypothetical protein
VRASSWNKFVDDYWALSVKENEICGEFCKVEDSVCVAEPQHRDIVTASVRLQQWTFLRPGATDLIRKALKKYSTDKLTEHLKMPVPDGDGRSSFLSMVTDCLSILNSLGDDPTTVGLKRDANTVLEQCAKNRAEQEFKVGLETYKGEVDKLPIMLELLEACQGIAMTDSLAKTYLDFRVKCLEGVMAVLRTSDDVESSCKDSLLYVPVCFCLPISLLCVWG